MKEAESSNSLIIFLMCTIISFFAISYVVLPQKEFSENENRMLQTAPKLTLSKVLDGTYFRQLHDYYSDQIIFRSYLIEAKALCTLALGKKENNGVILTADGYIVETHSYTSENYQYLNKNLARIEKMMENLQGMGVQSYSFVVPRKVDILDEEFSSFYSNKRSQNVWNFVVEGHTSLVDSLKNALSSNDIFYKTDHHLTVYGTYAVYLELSKALGFETIPLEQFNIKTLSNEFYGTSYSKSGFFFSEPDKIKAPLIDENKYQTTIVDTGHIIDGLYDYSYLGKKDKYSTFLSGNNAHTRITDKTEEKETILLIKDSYAHALAPFLCAHYNIELIDPRYFVGSIEKYITENNIEKVVSLFGISTLSSSNLNIK